MANLAQPLENEEIDLREVARFLIKSLRLIIGFALIFSVLGYFFANEMQKKYTSYLVLSPTESESSLGGMQQQLGSLASLAGISLGKNSNKTQEALEVFKSFVFFEKLMEDEKLKKEFFGSKGWDEESNELIFDPNLLDSNAHWLVDENKNSVEPSNQEIFRKFKKEHFIINEADKNGFIRVYVTHPSPHLAKQLLDLMISQLNEDMRNRAIYEADQGIKYLNEQIRKTKVSELRGVLYSLIQQQTQQKMLAKVRKEYVLKTIEPAKVEEKASSPNKILIIVLFFITGSILGIIFAIVRNRGLS